MDGYKNLMKEKEARQVWIEHGNIESKGVKFKKK